MSQNQGCSRCNRFHWLLAIVTATCFICFELSTLHGRSTPNDRFLLFCRLFLQYDLNSVIHTDWKAGSCWDRSRFMKELSFQHHLQHYSVTARTKEIQLCLYRFIGKSDVIKYHQLLSKVISRPIYGKSCFDQLATASSSTTPPLLNIHFRTLTKDF